MLASQIITKEYDGARNFMTLSVLRTGMLYSNTAYELSEGRGINNNRIFGVSFVRYFPETGMTKRLTNESKMFNSLKEAEEYILSYSVS